MGRRNGGELGVRTGFLQVHLVEFNQFSVVTGPVSNH